MDCPPVQPGGVLAGVPGFGWRLRNGEGGLAVVSLQLHLDPDGLLVLLADAQLLLGPDHRQTVSVEEQAEAM